MKTACIQINSGNDIEANIAKARSLVRKAAAAGAQWVLLPENVVLMSKDGKDLRAKAYRQEEHPALSSFQELAKELNIWLLIGSLAVKAEDVEDKLYNRSLLLNDQGEVVTTYNKIHLYDVELANGERYGESKHYAPGNKQVLTDTPWGKIGLTICYDIRFAYLYRSLAKAGAEFITVPSAFTKYTGEAHWHTLLRARAIETGSYILAPAQTGSHPGNRETFGHAMIIDPWGKILAKAEEEEGFIIADIDASRVKEVRQSLPSLQHDREFT